MRMWILKSLVDILILHCYMSTPRVENMPIHNEEGVCPRERDRESRYHNKSTKCVQPPDHRIVVVANFHTLTFDA